MVFFRELDALWGVEGQGDLCMMMVGQDKDAQSERIFSTIKLLSIFGCPFVSLSRYP